ncbi:MAG TPA: NDP-sugar synthase, partial [Actinomycetota bacterium]|nr:NDP-sugar synthase [Actinomycetota bacterium]
EPMIALILAAGAGTRIRPLSAERPKGLMPVLDLTPIHRHRAKLHQAGIDRVWVNSYLHTPSIEAAAHELTEGGMPTKVSVETGVLGTAGAIHKLKEDLREPFVVLNADIVTDLDLEALLRSHKESGALGTLAVVLGPRSDLQVSEGMVTDLGSEDMDRPGTTYCGVAVFDPEVVQMTSDEPAGLYEQIFVPLVSRGQMAAHAVDDYWRDIGTASSYLGANLDALDGALADEGLLRDSYRFRRWDHDAYVGEGASVDDCELERCVVGAGAQLEPGTALRRCVVWPNTLVGKGDHADAVITPQQVVRI